MKAVYLEKKAGAEALRSGEISQPNPAPGEVLVKVRATAVMPTELQWFPTFNKRSGEPRSFPIVLSHEFSGEVESVGYNVRKFKPGDEVFGLNDWFINGAQAEYCLAAETGMALKPKSLNHNEAAVVPISALTAWQGLIEKGHVERKQRVLIHGASGGVGTFAVQLARWRGAHVTATTSAANIEFVRALGADEIIDYHTNRFEDLVCDMDVIFDGVGGETLERSWKILKPNGRMITIATQTNPDPNSPAQKAFMLVRPDAAQLSELGKLIDAGELRVFMEAVYSLDDARDAFLRAQEGGMRGKIVLSIPDGMMS